MFSRKEFEKRCEEFEKFSPEEQRAKIMEWRDQELALRERFQKHLAELRLKQKDGTLDEEDSKRLERMEVLAKRFEKTRPPRHGPPHNGRPREGRDPVRPQDGPRAP
jgi:hypothetical protein